MFVPDETIKLVAIGHEQINISEILKSNTIMDQMLEKHHSLAIGMETLTRNMIIDDIRLQLPIWIVLADDKYKHVRPMYYRGSRGHILIYDVSKVHTFEHIKVLHREIKKYSKLSHLMVVGIVHLEEHRMISENMGRKLAENLGAKLFTEIRIKTRVIDHKIKLMDPTFLGDKIDEFVGIMIG